jgi:hypothetical protein
MVNIVWCRVRMIATTVVLAWKTDAVPEKPLPPYLRQLTHYLRQLTHYL